MSKFHHSHLKTSPVMQSAEAHDCSENAMLCWRDVENTETSTCKMISFDENHREEMETGMPLDSSQIIKSYFSYLTFLTVIMSEQLCCGKLLTERTDK